MVTSFSTPNAAFSKRNGQVFADVGATLRAGAPSAASSGVAEQIAEAEHLSEQIAEVHLLEAALPLPPPPLVKASWPKRS